MSSWLYHPISAVNSNPGICLPGTLALKSARISVSFYPLLRVWTCEFKGEMQRTSKNVTRSELVSKWNAKMYLVVLSITEIRTWIPYINSLTNFPTWFITLKMKIRHFYHGKNVSVAIKYYHFCLIPPKESSKNHHKSPWPATRKDMSWRIWHGIREEGRWKGVTKPTNA
jgi:hypothetical protein